MTDRIRSLTVVLADNTRDDDANRLIDAIRLMRGVVDVQADVTNAADYSAQMLARTELRNQIAAILWPAVAGAVKR